MTDCKLYSDLRTKETYFEIWGSSTKHADVVYRYSKFNASELLPRENPYNIFAWLCECASRMLIPTTTLEIVFYAQRLLKQYLCASGKRDAWNWYAEELKEV